MHVHVQLAVQRLDDPSVGADRERPALDRRAVLGAELPARDTERLGDGALGVGEQRVVEGAANRPSSMRLSVRSL